MPVMKVKGNARALGQTGRFTEAWAKSVQGIARAAASMET